jgi:hypothetical protein
MDQWEYLTLFLEAKASDKETKQFIRDRFDKKPRRFSPEAMIPELNELGSKGWELVHMEPLPRVGGKEDVQFNWRHWSHHYFCVFKRHIAQPPAPANLGQQMQQAAPPSPQQPTASTNSDTEETRKASANPADSTPDAPST